MHARCRFCTGQMSAYKTIMAYLEKYPFGSIGPCFAGLCCFVWCVWVSLELRVATRHMMAAVHLWGPSTVLSPPDQSGKRQVTALSTSRVTFYFAVQAIRVGLAVALLIGGLKFLVGTFNMSDLLLNVLAVGFVCLPFVCLSVMHIPVKVRLYRSWILMRCSTRHLDRCSCSAWCKVRICSQCLPAKMVMPADFKQN